MVTGKPHIPDVPEEIAQLLRDESLLLFGVADAEAAARGASVARAEYSEWIADGHQGGMDYLARHEPVKYDPARAFTGCRSVIVVGLNYYQERDSETEDGLHTSGSGERAGRIARYAWGRDYHNVFGKRLRRIVKKLRERHPEESFKSFVDASPLSERFFAEHAGVGITAKNTLTVNGAYGSWFFLGEIITTLGIAPTPTRQGIHRGCPRGCFRCGNVCPTDALFAPHRIDARRCISYLTIEFRGSIPVELRPLMGDWIFGCDLCQETCPLNLGARPTDVADLTTYRTGQSLSLGEILAIEDDAAYRHRFAGTPLMRPGRAAMIRNALIAAANTGARELLPRIRSLASNDNEVIREHARWAADQFPNV